MASTSRPVLIGAISAALWFMPGCGFKIGNILGGPIVCNTCPPSNTNFIYTANAAGSPSTVSALSANATTGALTAIASPYGTGTQSLALATDPSRSFLYVANAQSSNIGAFAINGGTGALGVIANSPFPAELGMDSLVVDPLSGQFLYAVTGSSEKLWAYSINNSTGALTRLSGTPMAIAPSGTNSSSVVIDPTGKYLYVTNETSGAGGASIYGFSRDPSSGAFTPLGGFPLAVDGLANTSVFDRTGTFLLVTGTNVFGTNGGIDVFNFNSSTGALNLSAGSPVQVGDGPAGIVVDGSGNFVYVPNTADVSISAFTLDKATGGLTTISGSPFPSGGKGSINGPLGITADSGAHVYVCNASNDISVFTSNFATGALMPITGSPFPDGGKAPSVIIFVQ